MAWSPDGKRIATALVLRDGNFKLAEVGADDGAIKEISREEWLYVGRVLWLPDGSGLLAIISAKGSHGSQVYLFSYPGGEARRVTNDTNNYGDLGLTADAAAFVTVQQVLNYNVWTLPFSQGAQSQPDDTRARQITNDENSAVGLEGLAAAPDGRIVYSSWVNNNQVLVICNADGSNAKRLDEEIDLYWPTVSPDGRYVVFGVYGRNGEYSHIYRVNADGGNLTKLTNGDDDESPTFTPDGRSIIYNCLEGGTKPYLCKVPVEGGRPARVGDKQLMGPVVSPDGKWAVGAYRETPDDKYRIAVLPLDESGGDQKVRTFDIPFAEYAVVRWTPDSRALAYVDEREGVGNVWAQPLAGGRPAQLTNFRSQQIASVNFSRDGKTLVLSRGTTSNDVVLISSFK